jgi:hypothetical protein
MVKVGADLRLGFSYMVQKLLQNTAPPQTAQTAQTSIPLTVVRDGKTMQISLPVVNKVPQLIPDLNGGYPSYFVYGPVVFSKATTAFLSFLASNPSSMAYYINRRSPLMTSRGASPTPEREELVVISSPYFPHRLAVGYGNPSGDVVQSVNGVAVRSLKHLVRLLRDNTEEFVRIDTDNKDGETLVFPHKDMLNALESILTDNSVRSQGTPELMDIWTKKVPD